MVSSLRLALARPPQAMNAMFSLLFRFWPRRNAGAAPNDSGGRQGPADELTARHLTLACLLRRLLHGSAPRRAAPRPDPSPEQPAACPAGTDARILMDLPADSNRPSTRPVLRALAQGRPPLPRARSAEALPASVRESALTAAAKKTAAPTASVSEPPRARSSHSNKMLDRAGPRSRARCARLRRRSPGR